MVDGVGRWRGAAPGRRGCQRYRGTPVPGWGCRSSDTTPGDASVIWADDAHRAAFEKAARHPRRPVALLMAPSFLLTLNAERYWEEVDLGLPPQRAHRPPWAARRSGFAWGERALPPASGRSAFPAPAAGRSREALGNKAVKRPLRSELFQMDVLGANCGTDGLILLILANPPSY